MLTTTAPACLRHRLDAGAIKAEKIASPKPMARLKSLLLVSLLGLLPWLAQAQLTYGTNDGTGTLYVSDYTGDGGEVIIPSSVDGVPVVGIGASAFAGCIALTGITIPDSVTYIGSKAFGCCWGLTNITLPNNVVSIGEAAFNECGLTSIIFPSNVANIDSYAFMFCWRLTNIVIQGSATHIGSYAFDYCTDLASVYFQGNAPVLSDGNIIFYGAGNAVEDLTIFQGTSATIYYLPGAIGWDTVLFGVRTVALFSPESPVIQDGRITLNWLAMPGRTCRVEYRPDLATGSWETVATNLVTTQLNMSLTLPVTGKQGFYRIGMEP